jgi:predicted polyphosphate/ATP-dependent NAD kinase
MSSGTVGIIANPASGKDIRRLVAHGSSFDNNEKMNIVRRLLLAMAATGVARVRYMPDSYAIVARAAEAVKSTLELLPLEMEILANPSDSYEAACRMNDLACDCVISLGGDGTNRVIAKGIGETPLLAISTGTNNVFPRMVEGTLAGLAAGLVATRPAVRAAAVTRHPRLDVSIDDEPKEMALIDVVTSGHAWIGARALWDPAHLREIVLSRVAAAEIGICGLGGIAFPEAAGTPRGVHIRIGEGGQRVLAPIAPGLVKVIPIASAALVEFGETVEMNADPCTVALDGEREFELLRPGHRLTVRLNPAGPNVVDVDAALQAGAMAGAFTLQ